VTLRMAERAALMMEVIADGASPRRAHVPSAGDNVTSKSISAPSNAKWDLWEQNVYGDQSLGRDGR